MELRVGDPSCISSPLFDQLAVVRVWQLSGGPLRREPPVSKGAPIGTLDPRNAFTDLDRAADPAGFVRVLDALTAMDAIRAYKRRTL